MWKNDTVVHVYPLTCKVANQRENSQTGDAVFQVRTDRNC